ncbi:MAG: leucine--tRNA ligase [Candidatus Pacebacteria bacterium]|nr:leucine--tRNA ligase [Candidatus Paceibacterota bacterium]
MSEYQPQETEKKWQDFWQKNGLFKAVDFGAKPKFYCLDMFPYPSGAGLHVGHPKGYTATDVICRYKRMKGFNVLHPMGWDAFGLPAENYAIKTKIHPDKSTHQNIERFREQIKSLGFSYDWQREVDTSSPQYYKWTQWFFLFLYKNGLAYKAKAPVNWCPKCQTVLANEQAQGGKCDRCSSEVAQKELEQWFFKITDFCEELLDGLDKIDWPEPIKAMQKNWIGRSEGYEIAFALKPGSGSQGFGVKVFTTRIDTIFGCTYLVVAPEHKIVSELESQISNIKQVEDYVEAARKKTELERQAQTKEKTGVRLEGITAINPANGKEIPIFVADYVLAGYGTGAIMAVPAHDLRDFEFAKKYGLPCPKVILPPELDSVLTNPMDAAMGKKDVVRLEAECWEGEGFLANSERFDGMKSEDAREEIGQWLGQKGLAEKQVNYKLRDWLVSRQRYWGAPIPVIYCDKCGQVPVPESDLPVLLPDDVDFMPSGESPLAKSKKFQDVKCPVCGTLARRENDTMDTFVCSSWYFFRYTDPMNKKEFAQRKLIDYWCPVDWYVGGAEHAVLHLLYARFFTKALFRAGLIGFDEPFMKLRNVGLVLAEGGEKMSKSKGNVINPDDVVKEYGADTLRCYEMFMGPFEQAIAWDTKGVKGVHKFLRRIYELKTKVKDKKSKMENREMEKLLHKTVKKVSEDIEQMKFNTAISSLMILLNAMEKEEDIALNVLEKFFLILSPFAPHLAEELWSELGNKGSVCSQDWPQYDENLVEDEKINFVVQINGKARGMIEAPRNSEEKEISEMAQNNVKISGWLSGREIKKVIFVKNKLINFVI